MNRKDFIVSASDEEKRKLYQRFCKDCNIPINIFKDPVFNSRLHLYNSFYDTMEKWDLLWDMLRDFDNVQDYFEYYNEIKDSAINFIKSTWAYSDFISKTNDEQHKYIQNIKKEVSNTALYSEVNHKKIFLSIDMRQANFNAMKYFNTNMFKNEPTWSEFMRHFSKYKYIRDSKYIRQVVLGNCNPKRQVFEATYLVCKLYEMLKPLSLNCIRIEADELIYEIDESVFEKQNFHGYLGLINKIIKNIENTDYGFIIPLNIELFRLYKVEGTDGYIKKCFSYDFDSPINLKLKCFNAAELPFVIRQLLGEDITINDKMIYSGDIRRMCVLAEPYEVSIDETLFDETVL